MSDYFRARNFLREVFLLNARLEHSWYLILTCQEILTTCGFTLYPSWNHHYWRDPIGPMAASVILSGYQIRSIGGESEHTSHSRHSWLAFHADEPVSNYDGDCSRYRNIQSASLYRRDLDGVAATGAGEIAGFCTIYYDDYTRSAVTVLVGVAAEHWQRGLGKALMLEGMQRLQRYGPAFFEHAHRRGEKQARQFHQPGVLCVVSSTSFRSLSPS